MASQEEFDALQTAHSELSANVTAYFQSYQELQAEVATLITQTANTKVIIQDCRRRAVESGRDYEERRRIPNTQLLKGKKPSPFSNKANYSGVEDLKADLYPSLSELRQFFNFAEEKHSEPFDHDFITRYLNNDHHNDKCKHGPKPRDAWATDAKIWVCCTTSLESTT